jgi:membrane protein
VKETRAWWRRTLLAILLTIALAALIITALALMFYGGNIAQVIANHYGLGPDLYGCMDGVAVAARAHLRLLAFELIYYCAPNLHEKQLRWLAPGAVIGVSLWLLVSFLFGSYLNLYNNYSVVYGSLGAVIILMLWFYLTGVAILVGGEVNAIIEQTEARGGDLDAKTRAQADEGQ